MTSQNCLHCRHCSIVPLGTGDVIVCHENPEVTDHPFSIPVKDAESHSCENYEYVSLRKFILTRPQLDALYNALSAAIASDRLFDTYELGIDTEDTNAYVAGCEWH